jgi:REP element-mobilizing transposase RayT
MASTFCNIKLHLVFSTKRREPMITPDLQPRLYAYIGGIIRNMNGTLLEIGGMNDHLHIFVGWRTDNSIANLARETKSQSSLWVHQAFPNRSDFGWQSGYAVFSVSQSQAERVRRYIQNQAVHHQRRDFQEEYLALLRAHGVEYNENYVFD